MLIQWFEISNSNPVNTKTFGMSLVAAVYLDDI